MGYVRNPKGTTLPGRPSTTGTGYPSTQVGADSTFNPFASFRRRNEVTGENGLRVGQSPTARHLPTPSDGPYSDIRCVEDRWWWYPNCRSANADHCMEMATAHGHMAYRSTGAAFDCTLPIALLDTCTSITTNSNFSDGGFNNSFGGASVLRLSNDSGVAQPGFHRSPSACSVHVGVTAEGTAQGYLSTGLLPQPRTPPGDSSSPRIPQAMGQGSVPTHAAGADDHGHASSIDSTTNHGGSNMPTVGAHTLVARTHAERPRHAYARVWLTQKFLRSSRLTLKVKDAPDFMGRQYFTCGSAQPSRALDTIDEISNSPVQRRLFWVDLTQNFLLAGIPSKLISPLTSHGFRRGFVASALALGASHNGISTVLGIAEGSVKSCVRDIIPTHADSFFNADLAPPGTTVTGSTTT
ncbi:hypothetical protein SARC_06117 [Sphaeroforma arctica JP610]|uniref:Uncharacterized protein n=1 Tax=Sphaeroforma arctica JP610 TaxID=667725 RepID=A0A0L0FXL6_9EUKA|nr:hypothetical protein SARC_06117 [Sphaeroforma arctica JP610]KNC81560.1 hypothetical protein SARC_06117 [Sphaeroforma arctica JP610]|eukprot:XP_014155462.1 hypothetical protein SARC_06117 [Sphaeroforma arctica JP610]